MQSSGATIKVEREIEAAAVALGFSRRVSQARVEKEMARYAPRRGTADLDYQVDRPRFQAVVALFFLMDSARNLDREIARFRRDLSERVSRVRVLVAKVAAT